MLTEKEEKLILEQLKYLQNEIISIQQGFISFVSIPLGVYALIVYYILNIADNQVKEILFLLLPFFFCLSFYNILKYTIKILGLESYQRHLENMINRNHEKPLFLWQSFFVYANGYSFIGSIGQFPCIFVIFIYFTYNFFEVAISTDSIPKNILNFLIIFYLLQIVFLVLMLFHCLRQYSWIENDCKKFFNEINNKEWEKNLADIETMYPPYIKNILKKSRRKFSDIKNE